MNKVYCFALVCLDLLSSTLAIRGCEGEGNTSEKSVSVGVVFYLTN